MEKGNTVNTKEEKPLKVLDLLIPGDFCTTVALYGPPQSGKTTLIADDLPDEDVKIIDTTRTFPFHTDKEVIVTTNVKTVLPHIEENKTIVVDDIFVFRGDDIKKMVAKTIETGARLIVVSQVRTFHEQKYYPYAESIVNNMNVCIQMERYEIRDEKMYAITQIKRRRGQWMEDDIRVPVVISNNRIDPETYRILQGLEEINIEVEK